jgi:hypothetical protein
MIKRVLVLLLCLPQFLIAQPTTPTFAKAEVLKDLDYLYESLQEAHYALNAYVPQETMDSVYMSVKKSVDKDSLSLLEATNTLQQLISAADMGHTYIDFPIQSYIEYAYADGTLFPLEVAFEDGKSLVRTNWLADEEIPVGGEILRINGKSMSEILTAIYPQISAERLYLKQAKIEMYSFPRYYWQVFGQQDDFEVDIRANGTVETYYLPAVPVIDGYEARRTEVLNATLNLTFYESAAYLNPGSFGGDLVAYQHFIDSAFAKINELESQNLIIDLRNNSGGDDAFSDYLVSYLAEKPFRWNAGFTLKTSGFLKEHVRQHNDTTNAYFRSILDHEDGAIYDYKFDAYEPQPSARRFKGEVYVLVNRQSHSQAAVAAAQIQDYGLGTIVGEETGDYPSLYASNFQFNLPKTGILVHASKGRIIRVNGSTKEQGVMPDIRIRDHLLDEEDEVLEGIIQRITANDRRSASGG